jgi:CTP synthase (UTP-ammonia lyase)
VFQIAERRATVAALGDRDPAHLTHREIDAAMGLAPDGAELRWVATDSREARRIDRFDGLWVLPGTPYRAEDVVLAAIRFARENGMPVLGTCGGFQYMAVEFARNAAGVPAAAHAETDPDAQAIVVGQLSCNLVGEERTVSAVAGTQLAALCGTEPFTGFHWCSYGLAPGAAERLSGVGLVMSAHAEDGGGEGFELPGHPFYLATLFQPQVGSSEGGKLHPLLAALCQHASRARPG